MGLFFVYLIQEKIQQSLFDFFVAPEWKQRLFFIWRKGRGEAQEFLVEAYILDLTRGL